MKVIRQSVILLFLGLVSLSVGWADDPWYVHYEKGKAAIDRSEWPDAIEHLSKAIAQKPKSDKKVRTYGVKFIEYFPYLYLGMAYFYTDRLVDALAALDKEEAQGQVKGSASDWEKLQQTRKLIQDKQAKTVVVEKRVEVERQKTPAELRREQAQNRLNEGLALLGEKKYQEALKVFKDILVIDPQFVQAQLMVKQTEDEIAKLAEARQQRERLATELQNGINLFNQGQHESALEKLNYVLALEPENTKAREYAEKAKKELAKLAAQKLGKTEIRYVERQKTPEELKQEQVAGKFQQAVTLFAQRRYPEAITASREVLALDPGHGQAQNLLERAENEIKQEEARRAREIQLAQDLQEALTLFQEGKFPEALQKATLVQALDPGNTQAKEVVEKARAELARKPTEVVKVERVNMPPRIILKSPSPVPTEPLLTPKLMLDGLAIDDEGVAKVEIRVNGELIPLEGERGVAIVARARPGAPAPGGGVPDFPFTRSIELAEGPNEVLITAYDSKGLTVQERFRVERQVKRGDIWAAVIGIGKYQKVPPLKYTVNDAKAFYDYLINVNRVPADHVFLLLDEEANLQNIKRVLGSELKRRAGKEDMVIIFYAGHGAPEPDAASPDGDGLEKYILPTDADPQDLYTTAIPMGEVNRIFDRLSSERVVFITDSCYSGAAGGRTLAFSRRASISDAFLDRISRGKGRVVLTASSGNEVSVEKDELGHGVFTYYLLEALKGRGDTNKDGVVTTDEAYQYIVQMVPKATGQNQHPVKKGEVEGELVLGRVVSN